LRSKRSGPIQARPGGRLGQAQIDDGLKALIETGLFQDVRINQAGAGSWWSCRKRRDRAHRFRGNKKVKDEQLSSEIQSKRAARFRGRRFSRMPSVSRNLPAFGPL